MSAAESFVKTEELLLLLLKSMHPETLLISKRVCAHWHTIIDREKNLQKMLFLKETECERVVLAEAGQEEFNGLLMDGLDTLQALKALRDMSDCRYWRLERGIKAPVEVSINPLLSKIFVHDSGDWFLSCHAIVDLRTTAEPGRDLPGGGGGSGNGNGKGKGRRVRVFVDGGKGFPGFDAPIKDNGDNGAIPASVGGRRRRGGRQRDATALDALPGMKLLPGKGAAGRYICDGGSYEKMSLTSPPIHKVRVLTRFVDGPMKGDNFMRYDTGKEPVTIGFLLRKLQQLATGSNYKFCWVRIVGEESFRPWE